MTTYFGHNVIAVESDPPRVIRGLLRPGLLMLAGLMALSPPGLVLAKAKPDLVVRSVLEPVPPGAQPGGGMFLQATVKARNPKGRKTKVVFYLAQDKVPGADDVQIASASIGSSPGSNSAIGVAAHLPAGIAPGLYFVLACAGAGNCAAGEATVQVLGQRHSAVNYQSGGLTTASAPAPEYFPEDPAAGMVVSHPLPCPFSIHGQWPSECQYVTTEQFQDQPQEGFMYCPIDHPFPYEVAIGDDVLWNDLGLALSPSQTDAVSFTKYKTDFNNLPFSYTGEKEFGTVVARGYAAFIWAISMHGGTGIAQQRYLCSDKPATDAAP